VVTPADTLEYDDLDHDIPFGGVAPNVAGTSATGEDVFVRVSHFNPGSQAEPYRLYAAVQPSAATATQEIEPNGTPGTATSSPNLYVAGQLGGTSDVDIYAFPAGAGELILLGLDADPARDGTPFNATLSLLDSAGTPLMQVNDGTATSSTVPGNGSLSSTTPNAPAEALAWRARKAGTYYARIAWAAGPPGDYLLSIARDCRIFPATDLAVAQSDSADPAPPGGTVVYLVAVTNQGAVPATLVRLIDTLPAGATLVAAVPSQGACFGSGPVSCELGTLGPGASASVAVSVIEPAAAGPVTNKARIESAVSDPDPGNDRSDEVTLVGGAADSDGDGAPDASDCAPSNGQVWAIPGPVTDLMFTDDEHLEWTPPADPGGANVAYDLLRSAQATGFMSATCLLSDIAAAEGWDTTVPAGSAFFYLVRSENACGGSLGAATGGALRTGVMCP